MANAKNENSNQNEIIFTLFRLIWTQIAYDFVDDFKVKKNYDCEMIG